MNPHAINLHRSATFTLSDEEQDRLFHALADSTRRDILRRCANAEPSVSELARNYSISLTAIQKHVSVLEGAGLVSRTRHGREQRVHSERQRLEEARDALNRLEATWRARVDRMANLLSEPD